MPATTVNLHYKTLQLPVYGKLYWLTSNTAQFVKCRSKTFCFSLFFLGFCQVICGNPAKALHARRQKLGVCFSCVLHIPAWWPQGINWTPTGACGSSFSSVAQEPPTCSCLWGGQRISCRDVACACVLAAVGHQLQGNMWKSYISCWGQTSYRPAVSKVQGRIAKFDGISTTAIKQKTFFSSVSLMLA